MDEWMHKFQRGEWDPEELEPELEAAKVTTPKGVGITHKFISDAAYDPSFNGWYNSQLAELSESAERAKCECRWLDFVNCHQENFYPHALEEILTIAPPDEWAAAFRHAWYISKAIMLNEGKWRMLLGKIGTRLMTDEERALLGQFPETFQIFRGCSKESDTGLSWSKEYEWAKWFARNCHGVMIKGIVKKPDVIAYLRINGEEHEIIVFPEKVANLLCVGRWFDI